MENCSLIVHHVIREIGNYSEPSGKSRVFSLLTPVKVFIAKRANPFSFPTIRADNSCYCRVLLMIVIIFSHYAAFGVPEKRLGIGVTLSFGVSSFLNGELLPQSSFS